MSKIVKAEGALTETTTTFTEDLVSAVKAPFGILTNDADATEFASPRTLAITALGYMVGGALIDARFGASIPGLSAIRV